MFELSLTSLVTGALLPWRWAVGGTIFGPIVCFLILLFCPETPTWYISKGRDEEAKEALEKLRGAENQDIIEAEFNRISLNQKIQEKEREIDNDQEEKLSKVQAFKRKFHLLIDPGFIKPFGFLMLIFLIGLEWGGFPAIAFYMVPLLKNAEIPFDPYWAAAMLASYRALIAIVGSSVTKGCKRRPQYITCSVVLACGLFLLSTYCYFNQEKLLTENFPVARWIPILALMIIYTAFSFGYGSIPYILQVRYCFLKSAFFSKRIFLG